MPEKKEIGGLLMQSWTSHPVFYPQKQATEKRLGRTLTTAEFLEQHFIPPTDDAYSSGTSIFDPVLTELAYRWFSPVGGTVLDPFAGGSVRGIVASKLGRQYVGHELRPEQVEANRLQAETICAADEMPPVWVQGDSRNIHRTCADVRADMIFSCPPYADLEVYSDDPDDISTLDYSEFVPAYREIIARAASLLLPDRFACFVVGDVRDKRGNYYNFVGDTIEAFRAAGLHYYNEAILVTAVGSLPIRVGKQFSSSRKLGKTHQNILVFVKGDGKAAAAACGECQFGEIDAAEEFGEVME
jgi:DNA modification methylase